MTIATVLFWTLTGCGPTFALNVYADYIYASGSHADGWWSLPPTQDSFALDPQEPMVGHAVGWKFPIAVDIEGEPMPEACQPIPVSVDGVAWEGM